MLRAPRRRALAARPAADEPSAGWTRATQIFARAGGPVIKLMCSACGAKYTLHDEKLGERTVERPCMKCGATVIFSRSSPHRTDVQPARPRDPARPIAGESEKNTGGRGMSRVVLVMTALAWAWALLGRGEEPWPVSWYLVLAVVTAIALYSYIGKRSDSAHTTPVRRVGRRSTPEENLEGAGEDDREDAPITPPAVAMNAETAAFEYLDHTVVYYEPQHGNQIEYYGRDGKAYLWYPGNRGVVVSEWRIDGGDYCERSPPNVYNPVTHQWSGQWERRPVDRLLATKVDAARGDIFGLSTGRIPYRLHAHPGFRSVVEVEHPPAVVQMPPPLRPVRPPPKAVDDEAPCPCASGESFANCHGVGSR